MSETKPESPPEHDSAPETGSSGTDSKASPTAAGNLKNALETTEEPAENTKEIGGRDGPDPTRFGDWEKAGRCIDF